MSCRAGENGLPIDRFALVIDTADQELGAFNGTEQGEDRAAFGSAGIRSQRQRACASSSTSGKLTWPAGMSRLLDAIVRQDVAQRIVELVERDIDDRLGLLRRTSRV